MKEKSTTGGDLLGMTPEKDNEEREKRIKHQITTPTQAKACVAHI